MSINSKEETEVIAETAGTGDLAIAATAAAAVRRAGHRHALIVVFGGVIAANLGNYLFQIIAARYLGPRQYGDVATLLTLANLVSLPLGALQIWVARRVAQLNALGDSASLYWFIRRAVFSTFAAGVIVVVLLESLAPSLRSVLGIESTAGVALTFALALPAVTTPIIWGLTQGLERFGLISLMVASGPLARILVGTGAFAFGFGVSGAMGATLIANFGTMLVPLCLMRRWLPKTGPSTRRLGGREIVTTLVPVIVGTLAITALTSVDVVVAKGALGSRATGIYGSASLIGRVILYLPTAIVTVLLPRVASLTTERRASLDLLGRSLALASICSIGLTLVYLALPRLVLVVTFGSTYYGASPLLWRMGVAMTAFALLNVLLIYHLARSEHRVVWLLAAGSIGQILVFSVVHGSSHALVTVDIGFGIGLLLAHEAITGATTVRALGTALRNWDERTFASPKLSATRRRSQWDSR